MVSQIICINLSIFSSPKVPCTNFPRRYIMHAGLHKKGNGSVATFERSSVSHCPVCLDQHVMNPGVCSETCGNIRCEPVQVYMCCVLIWRLITQIPLHCLLFGLYESAPTSTEAPQNSNLHCSPNSMHSTITRMFIQYSS